MKNLGICPKVRNRFSVLFLALLLTVSLSACGGQTAQNTPVTEEIPETDAMPQTENTETADTAGTEVSDAADTDEVWNREAYISMFLWEDVNGTLDGTDGELVPARIAALKGPTAMGLVKFMSEAEAGHLPGRYEFSLAAAPDEVTPLLIKGDLDIACVPANLASVLYNRTEGQIVTLAINTLGVLYIVENGNTIESLSDLAGRTIVASGKGATPEYALRYLLTLSGIDPDLDVTIDWKSEHSECVAALASGAATIAMLPQPFVTVAQNTLDTLRVALDLTQEWNQLTDESKLVTGVVAARREFVENNPNIIGHFLNNYADSVTWVNSHVPEAAALIGEYDIVAAPIAEKALPYCNIVCMTGESMGNYLSGYLQTLYDAAPEAVGGALPGDDFYYNNADSMPAADAP